MIHKMLHTIGPSDPPREWEGDEEQSDEGGGDFPRKESFERKRRRRSEQRERG